MNLTDKEQWARWILLGDPFEVIPKPLVGLAARIHQALGEYELAMQLKRKDDKGI